jgi:hypothetical protein
VIEQWRRDASTGRWTRTRTEEPGDHDNEAPPPAVRPMRFDPNHPSVPPRIRSIYQAAVDADWAEVILSYSQVPKKRVNPVWYEQVHTLGVLARRPGIWVAMFWSYEKGKWAADGANIRSRSATHTEVKEVLRDLGQ